MREKQIPSGHAGVLISVSILVLSALAALMLAFTGVSYAAEEQSSTEAPIRVVHNVKVDDKNYCFFVQHNVILKPEELYKIVKIESETEPGTEIEETVPLTDEELTDLVLERAGLYMKETNCTKADHKSISIEDWEKDKGSFILSADDISAIRDAAPAEGSPVKLHMDVSVCKEAATEETQMYSTYSLTGPELIFVVVANEKDAGAKEDICIAEKKEETPASAPVSQPAASKKKVTAPKAPAAPEEELPEFKTIKMLNRAGGPLEETLKDGTPVTLTWKDVGKRIDDGKTGFFSHIVGGFIGFILILIAITCLLASLAVAIKRRRNNN